MALGSFSVDLKRFADKVNVKWDLIVKKVMLDLFSRIVQRTPVDTGRARGGWQVDISLRSTDTGRRDKDGGSTIADGRAKIQGLVTTAAVIGYLFNNVEYIHPLEYGSSMQAPAGMVRISIAEFVALVENAAR